MVKLCLLLESLKQIHNISVLNYLLTWEHHEQLSEIMVSIVSMQNEARMVDI